MLCLSVNPTGETMISLALWNDGALSAVRQLNPGRGTFKERLRFFGDSIQDYFWEIKDKTGQRIETGAYEEWRVGNEVVGLLGPAKMLELVNRIATRMRELVDGQLLPMTSPVTLRPIAMEILKEKRIHAYQRNIGSVMTGLAAGFGWAHKDAQSVTGIKAAQLGFVKSMDTLFDKVAEITGKAVRGEEITPTDIRNIFLVLACAELPGIDPEKRRQVQMFGTRMKEVRKICADIQVEKLRAELAAARAANETGN